MLLLHQIGSVKIGEVVRYTVTYTPSRDRILPSPEFLYLRIRNSSAIALRAAFVHGPYTLSVAAYPATFNPNEKFTKARTHGVPEFEPMLKAGGSWNCHLIVPDAIRQTAGTGGGHFGGHDIHVSEEGDPDSVSWIIEVSSQVIFSTSAAVGYEILVARDEKVLNTGTGLSLPIGGGQSSQLQPGKISDHQQSIGTKDGHHSVQPKGVFSRAISIRVDDTASLWNTPRLPEWDDQEPERVKQQGTGNTPAERIVDTPEANHDGEREPRKKRKKVHLVVLTHGLHSNLGADMLFLKESIDAAVKQAKIDAKARRAKERAAKQKVWKEAETTEGDGRASAPTIQISQDDGLESDDEDEEVIVRGFSGNATRTERGIKYLGKRLAKYILSMTFPDQPYYPTNKAASETVAQIIKGDSAKDPNQSHHRSSIQHQHHQDASYDWKRAYRITSISFIAHSLGGLVQTYAVAYIQKHSPQFFDIIQPINFIAMASPFLGLSNENPLYVKFALDFGLVGRTGQDLGLTWRAPTIARSGWGAIVSNLGETAHKKVLGESQPESKPLLRILPTGPAHTALQKFRNRTVYSNVVNDGIVPLRTSCLLFLDWQGLDRVEKARREAGLVETVVGFGWAELTGANMTSPRNGRWLPKDDEDNDTNNINTTDGGSNGNVNGSGDPGEVTMPGSVTPRSQDYSHDVPLPPTNATIEDDRQSLQSLVATPYVENPPPEGSPPGNLGNNEGGPFSGFFSLFQRDNGGSSGGSNSGSGPLPKSAPPPTTKANMIYRRSQTLKADNSNDSPAVAATTSSNQRSSSRVTTGHELSDHVSPDGGGGVSAPPRTTFFESAGDLLNPKLPSVEYFIDPSKRSRTIFHDRVYHPTDIPPPPLKKRPTSSSLGAGLRRRSFTRAVSVSSTGTRGSSPYRTTQEDSFRDYYDVQSASGSGDPKDNSNTTGVPLASSLDEIVDSANMKVEEKIARAYHRGLSWRKVLVKLEPDAHNNIIVRRMFANAFGWPVVKHLVDAHFSDSAVARTSDEAESSRERAKDLSQAPSDDGKETKTTQPEEMDLRLERELEGSGTETEKEDIVRGRDGTDEPREGEERDDVESKKEESVLGRITPVQRTDSEAHEAMDEVPDLPPSTPRSTRSEYGHAFPHAQGHGKGPTASAGAGSKNHSHQLGYMPPPLPAASSGSGSAASSSCPGPTTRPVVHDRIDSVTWSERDFADSGDESDDESAMYQLNHFLNDGDKTPTPLSLTTPTVAATADNAPAAKGKEIKRASSPLSALIGGGGWNWTEKIVGKGAGKHGHGHASSKSTGAVTVPVLMSPTVGLVSSPVLMSPATTATSPTTATATGTGPGSSGVGIGTAGLGLGLGELKPLSGVIVGMGRKRADDVKAQVDRGDSVDSGT